MIGTAELHKRFLECAGACTDTRQLVRDGMFFALKGPRFNANEMAASALENGCKYAVVDDPNVVVNDRFLQVNDVLHALQDLGRHHRRHFNIPVVAITGSNGKTTTKELVHAVLSAKAPTLATIGNLNNHIGVPLTLLRMNADHHFAIIEMGANHIGDIAQLTTIAEPTHGLITNIGKAHLEGFGSYAGVVEAKTELFQYILVHQGGLFVNADDELLMQKSSSAQRITYGTSTNAMITGHIVPNGPFLGFAFDTSSRTEHRVRTQLIGDYNLPNALAAVSVGMEFGVPATTIVEALEAYAPGNNRSQFKDTGRNHLVLDAYNANPSSMQVALRNFAAMVTDRPKLVMLGDMLELGTDSEDEHNNIVALLTELQLKAWLIGPEFGKTGRGNVHLRFSTAAEALASAQTDPISDHLILIKGSRGIKLETIVPAL
ncbi:MAG: UDP-N-acetylmuramoyl-tripeptide--D-alanyl-D-alanine ligase [Flavobacteriales bacterium]|nr:UDP-N-acetylmuramoyl-tripeptide--D-alanyl-D-alanine ligase [Flavobacteriales bacterium]